MYFNNRQVDIHGTEIFTKCSYRGKRLTKNSFLIGVNFVKGVLASKKNKLGHILFSIKTKIAGDLKIGNFGLRKLQLVLLPVFKWIKRNQKMVFEQTRVLQ